MIVGDCGEKEKMMIKRRKWEIKKKWKIEIGERNGMKKKIRKRKKI